MKKTQKALLLYNLALYFAFIILSWFSISETSMFSSATKQVLYFVSVVASLIVSIFITEKKSKEGGLQ
jgi:hypothetical protein